MHSAPRHVGDDDILQAARHAWRPDLVAVEHLPVGFGAWHWRADAAAGPALFLTLDVVGSGVGRHSTGSLEAAYRSAAALAEQLDEVVAPIVTLSGHRTVPCGVDRLSATPWFPGARPDDRPNVTREFLARLHASPPPAGMPRWDPRTPADLPDQLAALTGQRWDAGPYAARAHAAVSLRLNEIRVWSVRYHTLARLAEGQVWVPTHGEPGQHNQWLSGGRHRWLDWESLQCAPAERDTRAIGTGDPLMLEMYDLEWRLDEIHQYAHRFAAPHPGDASDDTAFGGLIEELNRP